MIEIHLTTYWAPSTVTIVSGNATYGKGNLMTLMHPATALLVAHAIQEDRWASAEVSRARRARKGKKRQ